MNIGFFFELKILCFRCEVSNMSKSTQKNICSFSEIFPNLSFRNIEGYNAIASAFVRGWSYIFQIY